MTEASLPDVECVDCGMFFVHPPVRGARRKRCDKCRAEERRQRGSRSSKEPGAVLQVRELLRESNPTMQRRVAAEALTHCSGLPGDIAMSIIETIDVLIDHGETPVKIRARLNPNPANFAVKPAGENTVEGLLGFTISTDGGVDW